MANISKACFSTDKNNKSGIMLGQYTKEILLTVCTVSNSMPYIKPTPCSSQYPCIPCQNDTPIKINPNEVFYQKYVIDPLGELFGKTPCGTLNYTRYMTLYFPTHYT